MSDDRIARGLSRRRFLIGAAATGAGAVALPGLLPRFVLAADPTSSTARSRWCSSSSGEAWTASRRSSPWATATTTTLGPAPRSRTRQAHPLDGRFGLHPALGGLEGVVGRRADRLRSCSRNPDGRPEPLRPPGRSRPRHALTSASARAGWLATWRRPREPGPRPCPPSTSDMPGRSLALHGADRAIALDRVSNFGVTGFKAPDRAIDEALRSLYGIKSPTHPAVEGGGGHLRRHRHPRRDQRETLVARPRRPTTSAPLGLRLRQVAILLRSGVGVELANIDIGGWDLHNSQGDKDGRLAMQFTELGQSLAAFAADIQRHARPGHRRRRQRVRPPRRREQQRRHRPRSGWPGDGDRPGRPQGHPRRLARPVE